MFDGLGLVLSCCIQDVVVLFLDRDVRVFALSVAVA